jgi:hypothetical protein
MSEKEIIDVLVRENHALRNELAKIKEEFEKLKG